MSTGRVVVVGLGPGDPALLTVGAIRAIEAVEPAARFVRTWRHPSASEVPGAESFDDLYESASTLDEVYRSIVERLTEAAARRGTVLYAVPGSPRVAERSVELLCAAGDGPEVELVAGLSFLDLAWPALGVDPVAEGVRIIDGHRFDEQAAGSNGPFLVAQCDRPDVLEAVKLAVDETLERPLEEPAAEAELVVLRGLGTGAQQVTTLAWHELDRIEADHLTSVWVPRLAAPVHDDVTRFVELVVHLRSHCPWDAEQTHASLRRHLLEETYEVLEAIDSVDPAEPASYEELAEELGDLLFQVVFHATLAAEEGRFDLGDVARGIHDKLYDRHPHVFGDVVAEEASDVVAGWEQRKLAEKGRQSVFDGIPAGLPALAMALKIQKKTATLDPTLQRSAPVIAAPEELLAAISRRGEDLGAADTDGGDDELFGELLMAVVEMARRCGVDPEGALRLAAAKRRDAVRSAETATTE